MKLRVRLAAADAPLLRLEIEPHAPASELLAACRAHFSEWLGSSPSSSSSSSPAPLRVSLNKRDALPVPDGGGGTCTVASLGVTSGDLLWIMDAVGVAGKEGGGGASAGGGALALASAAAAGAARAAGAAGAPAPAPPASKAKAAGAQGGDAMEEDEAEEEQGAAGNEHEEEQHAAAAATAAPPPILPPMLRRVLQPDGGGAPPPASPAALLSAAVHAAMLEAGFMPAVEAAASSRLPGRRRRQLYRHAALSYSPLSAAGGAAAAADAARAAEGVAVEVRCAPLGGASVLVAGAVVSGGGGGSAGGGVVSLALPVGEYAAEGDEEAADGRGAQFASPAATAALWRLLRDNLCLPLLLSHHRAAGLPPPMGLLALPADLLVREVLPRVVRADLEAAAAAAVAAAAAEEEAFERTRQSSAPALQSVRRYPPGSQPSHARPSVEAAKSAARALASCCLASPALRSSASSDELWRPVFEAVADPVLAREFRLEDSVRSLRLSSERRGWQWATRELFARVRADLQRRSRRDTLGRMVEIDRARRARASLVAPPPPAPGYGPPGIVGGDYDRLPAQQPSLAALLLTAAARRQGAAGGMAGGGGGGFAGGAAGSAMPGPSTIGFGGGVGGGGFAPLGIPGRRGGRGGGARDFSLRH
jgi:hypothetical protein